MSAFQDTREHTEQKVMVHLLSEIERNPSFTQRGLASELGIALGLMNQYLKRSIMKGWIGASQLSPRRIAYFLTPEGFKEKSLLVTDYIGRSLTFFRDARSQCEQVFNECIINGWQNIALMGAGDLADIAILVANGKNLSLTVVDTKTNLKNFDAVLITNVKDPQGTYDTIQPKIGNCKLLTLKLLHISRKGFSQGFE